MKIEVRIAKQLGAFGLDIQFTSTCGVTVLFGPSGSGKTLTLDSIAGFTKPSKGRIQLDDRILFDSGSGVFVPPRLRGCGYVVQDHALFPHMTLRQNLDFAAAALPTLDRRRKVNEMLERFRLDGGSDRKPHQMSGGQKQRASIARALLAKPSLLLLDEPSRGLDAELKAELYAVLRQARGEFETPMFLVSHDLDECLELGEQMLVLHEGRMIECGPPHRIVDRPQTQETARLLGLYNVFEAEILALDPSRNTSRIRAAGHELTGCYLPGHFIGDRVRMCIRRNAMQARPRSGSPAENETPVVFERSVLTARGMRLEFEGGLFVDTTCMPAPTGEWLVRFPPSDLQLLSS